MIKLNKQAEAKHQLMLQLESETDLLATQLHYITRKNAQLLNEHQLKNSMLEIEMQRHQNLTNIVKQLQIQHTTFQGQRETSLLEDTELTDKIVTLKQTLEKIVNAQQQLNEEIKMNEQRLCQLRAVVQSTADRYEKAEEQVISIRNQIEEKKQIIQTLQRKIKAAQKDILAASERIKPSS